ncbi:MAG: aminotransferase class IV [Kiritimatiellae bacterium]|nr:aminotransferase class IV [Kiritimatiellia bacterium]
MEIGEFSREDFLRWCDAPRPAAEQNYYACFSTLWGNRIATDPALMQIPLDDHMVHRADGLFETMRVDDGAMYRWDAHFARLAAGAEAVRMPLPWSRNEMTEIIREVLRRGGKRDALIRLFVSRGGGGHTAGRAECQGPHLWILAVRRAPDFMDAHPEGAKAVTSAVPVKQGFFARVKSVGYLPNALMAEEAKAKGADFALAYDGDGFLAEMQTENCGIVSADGVLQVPREEHILRGTTMQRVLEIAEEAVVVPGLVKRVERADIPREAVETAKELLVFGTTPVVTAAVSLDGKPVGAGKPGPVARALYEAMKRDMRDPANLTRLA